MVRKLFALVLGVALLGVTSYVTADDKKEENKAEKVTLEGKLVCTKCELKETKACGHALLVTDAKDKTKEVKYYLADKGGKEKYHVECCQAPADAKVTGVVVEKKEKDVTKLTITEPKVEIVKDKK